MTELTAADLDAAIERYLCSKSKGGPDSGTYQQSARTALQRWQEWLAADAVEQLSDPDDGARVMRRYAQHLTERVGDDELAASSAQTYYNIILGFVRIASAMAYFRRIWRFVIAYMRNCRPIIAMAGNSSGIPSPAIDSSGGSITEPMRRSRRTRTMPASKLVIRRESPAAGQYIYSNFDRIVRMSEREAPLDLLAATIDEGVLVRLKSGVTYGGTLESFDQHLNVVLSGDGEPIAEAPTDERGIEAINGMLVIRGDTVESITLSE